MQSTSFFDLVFPRLGFPFKDNHWFKKLAIGFGVSLSMFIVPVLPYLLLAGYARRIMKRILLEDGEPYLPDWKDWGNLLSEGLPLWGAGLIYSLPLTLLMLALMLVFFLSLFVPAFLLRPDGSLPPGASLIPLLGLLVFFAGMAILMLLGLVTGLFQATALGCLVEKNSFSAAFRPAEWWPVLKQGFSAFLAAYLILMGLSFIGMVTIQILYFTIVFLFLYPLLLALFMFLSLVYSYSLYALAYREGRRRLAQLQK